jgi:hypothetical protein
MTGKQTGILLISDITGYTTFLNSSELEHAQDTLRSLLELLVDHTSSPLIISRLEGDAVISYAPRGSYLQGQTIVELIERTYLDFRRALDLMVLNTTCTCKACRNISNLDLKFFVHYGSFMLEPIHTYIELVGSDVILLHRLTKNSVVEKTGIKAYVLYTQVAVDELGIDEFAESMHRHAETYEDFGEVISYIEDMHVLWEDEKSRSTQSVQPDDAALSVEMEIPLSKAQSWDYVTGPEYVAILNGSETARVDNKRDGRIGQDAIYYCAHGTSITRQTIIDWQPPDEFTWASDPIYGVNAVNTTRLISIETGTRVVFLLSLADGGHWISRFVITVIFRLIGIRGFKKRVRELKQRILADVEEGITIQPTVRSVSGDEVETAALESLAVR